MPDYICRIARAIKKTGKTTSQAIAIAVSRVKVWASGKGVDKDTQGKAAEAVAAWEALRAKSHAKTAGKKSAHALAASAAQRDDMLCLAATSFNTDAVRQAWYGQAAAWDKMNGSAYSSDSENPTRPWVKELWTDYLIVQCDDGGMYRVDYEVADDGDVTFDDPSPVKVQYVSLSASEMVGHDISDTQLLRMVMFTPRCEFDLAVNFAGIGGAAKASSAVGQLLALAADKSTGNQYGDVAYADAKNKKYPVDTADHVRAAWSYINKASNQSGYSSSELATIKSKIKSAAKKFNIDISDG